MGGLDMALDEVLLRGVFADSGLPVLPRLPGTTPRGTRALPRLLHMLQPFLRIVRNRQLDNLELDAVFIVEEPIIVRIQVAVTADGGGRSSGGFSSDGGALIRSRSFGGTRSLAIGGLRRRRTTRVPGGLRRGLRHHGVRRRPFSAVAGNKASSELVYVLGRDERAKTREAQAKG